MVNFLRNWTSNLNFVGSDGGTADVTEQYQNIVFEFHTMIKAAGWTVQFSSDGTTASAADNITATTDVVNGTEGSEAHSWAVYRNPAGWVNGGFTEILWTADNPSADSTPDIMRLWVSENDQFTGGTTIDRPTASNERATVRTSIVPQGASALVPSHVHSAWNDEGDFWFGTSIDGTTIMERFIWLGRPDLTATVPNGGPDNNTHAWWLMRTDQPSGNNFYLSSNTIMPHIDATLINTVAAISSAGELVDQWTNGFSSASSRTMHFSINMGLNTTNAPTFADRYTGRAPDVRAVPDDLTPGVVEDGDTDLQRYVSIGVPFVPVTSSQLPITL